MCRFSILHHVSSLPLERQTAATKDVVELVKVGGGNAFSTVVLLKSIAHSEVISTARPPLIIPGRLPTEIEIAGLLVTATDIRNV